MSGIVGSKFNHRGSGVVAKAGTDGQHLLSSGAGNIIIGETEADSATADRQLKIAGYDGTTRTTWISGTNDGNLEVTTNWNPSLTTTGKALVMGF